MRRGGAWVLVLLCAGLAGCLSADKVRPPKWLDNLRAPRLALGPDGVLIDLVLIEQPLGDAFLNEEIWKSTDRQVAGLERKTVLDHNGLRVGQVVGMSPTKLQNLLASDRHCVSRRRQILATGGATSVILGATQPQCNFRLRTDAGTGDVLLDQAQCNLLIEPALTGDGRTRLKFTPQVLYGSILPDYQAVPQEGWRLQYKRPSKTYPELSWEVTLAPNQQLVIGTHFDETADEDEPQTLGSQCFLVPSGRTFVQRLLVVRTTRGSGETIRGQVSHEAGPMAEPQPGEQPVAPAAHCLRSPGD